MKTVPPEALEQLKIFINLLKLSPEVLNQPELRFFKEYIESLGGKVPCAPKSSASAPKFESTSSKPSKPAAESKPVVESEESDVELDDSGVIEPDTPEPLKEYEPTAEITDDAIDKSNEKKIEAITALQEGECESAFKLFSEAIETNPNSALLYAKRGQCSLKRSKPVACIQDCTRALLLNPDCALAYKYRGRAHRLLGHWEEAAQDLRNACKIDFDEEADEWLREVTPNARKLEDHRRKYERKRAEKELRDRVVRAKHAREEHAKAAAKEAASHQEAPAGNDGIPGGLFGMMNDPDIKNAFSDPEVASAFEDISKNPANILKYQDNPKILAIIEKVKNLCSKGGGFGGLGGGLGGNFGGGFGGGFNPFSGPPPPPGSSSNDVDLD